MGTKLPRKLEQKMQIVGEQMSGVLGYPIGFTTGRRASPAWSIASLQIVQMLSGFQCTYKRKYGRLHLV